ncbi:HAD family hydrolase [Paraburkholderia tropica]|uniref:hypothetical protein n=1 Tax=Paraburkholderia tropica TaxID=92647 RepID=UPI002AB6A81A|nr:hypothetical protein [Paraburkholderia tropica]
MVRLDVPHWEDLPKAVTAYGIDVDLLAHGELDELNLAWHRLDPWPDSVEGLLRLKRRFMIAPLSNGNNLAAARACGLSTAFVPRPVEYGAGRQTDLRADQEWDYVATGINDLATQLGCPV